MGLLPNMGVATASINTFFSEERPLGKSRCREEKTGLLLIKSTPIETGKDKDDPTVY